VERFVYNQKYATLLIAMSNKTTQIPELAKEHNINSGHLRVVIDQFSKENIVKKKKDGRDYKLSLTKKGECVSKILAELIHAVKNFKELP